MVCRSAGLEQRPTQVVRVYANETLGPVRDYAAAIITGSPANVTDKLPWSEQTAGWIRDAMDAGLPVLGICYGHQLMAYALGGRVDYNGAGRETGTQMVSLTAQGLADELLQGVPARFAANLIHEQSVIEVPSCATVLAYNEHDPFQMLRLGDRAVSMQFHPEFSAPIMSSYIEVLHEMLAGEGANVAALAASVEQTPHATGIARSFVERYSAVRVST